MIHQLSTSMCSLKKNGSWFAHIAVQTLGGVCLLGEAVVLVGALCVPGLAGDAQDGDGGRTPVCVSIPNFTV